MTQVIDKICKLRDAVTSKNDNKLVFYHGIVDRLCIDLKRHLQKKVDDYSYELDFTSQDLRELAQDIRSMFKRWDTTMNPEKNVKYIHKNDIKDGNLTLQPHFDKVLPVITARRDNISKFTELLSLCEHFGVVLYFCEIAAEDEFAINYTERLI